MVSVPALLPAKVPSFLPTPDRVAAAAGNVAHKVLYGGIADLRPMPRQLIDEGMLREVYHYRPAADVVVKGRIGVPVFMPRHPERGGAADDRAELAAVDHGARRLVSAPKKGVGG